MEFIATGDIRCPKRAFGMKVQLNQHLSAALFRGPQLSFALRKPSPRLIHLDDAFRGHPFNALHAIVVRPNMLFLQHHKSSSSSCKFASRLGRVAVGASTILAPPHRYSSNPKLLRVVPYSYDRIAYNILLCRLCGYRST